MVPSATDLSVVSSGELSILTRKEYKNYNYINHKIDVSFYRAVNNSNYGWRALRLLARRSPHFFQPTNQQFKSLPEYLENMVIKLATELPVSRSDECFILQLVFSSFVKLLLLFELRAEFHFHHVEKI